MYLWLFSSMRVWRCRHAPVVVDDVCLGLDQQKADFPVAADASSSSSKVSGVFDIELDDVALIRNNPQRRRRSDVSRRDPCDKVKAKIARAQLPRYAEYEQRPSPGFPRWKS
jgi:hypothetical protein